MTTPEVPLLDVIHAQRTIPRGSPTHVATQTIGELAWEVEDRIRCRGATPLQDALTIEVRAVVPVRKSSR